MSTKAPTTKAGFEKLKEELKTLISVERTKVIQDISEARDHGDLKENAEYHSAKEKQGMIEGRIQYLNHLIANAEVVDIASIDTDKILFGATVAYEDTETGEVTTWQIVGQEEGNVKENKISVQSPIAKALIGKAQGDTVKIRIPKGDIEVEIISVAYN